MAYQLLSKLLEDKTNISPLIICSANEWATLADPCTNLGIVVDDMCGKHGLPQSELKKCNENVRFITALIENRKHIVIFTMRTHIHEETAGSSQLESDISDPIFVKDITLNLDDVNMALSETDKIEFANRYLNEHCLNKDEVLQLCRKHESSIGFPLLCRNAHSIKGKSELFDLFDRPLQIMLRELDRLREHERLSYGCLVLTMLLGGTLTLESINEYLATNDMKNQIKLIFDSCARTNVNLAEIQQAAKALSGTYLSLDESDESYTFFHNTVKEAVFLSYGKHYLTETIKLCSLRSLCKLLRVKNGYQDLRGTAATLMLDLPPKYFRILIERFIKALNTKCPKDFATIAEASVWSSDVFRKVFMDECKTIHVLDHDQNTLLVHAANANNNNLAIELLRNMKQIYADNQQAVSCLTKATRACCIHKDLCLFRHFIKTGIVNVNDILSVTIDQGSEEAMTYLLQNGADINYRSKNGESLLHAACLHGRLNMIELLLSKTSLPVYLYDNNGRSVCHSAASGGRVDFLEFLVTSGADPLCTDIEGMNLLQYACLEGNTEMAFYLMENYLDMLYSAGRWRHTVPHCAAYGGSVDMFNKDCEIMNAASETHDNISSEGNTSHCQKQADLKERTKLEETLLHMACLSGKLELTKYLVEKYPDMIKEVNKHNASIAHYAAAAGGGNVSILEYLITQGLDPWCTTSSGQTLLHLSCISGRLEKTQYLLEKYPDMIKMTDKSNRTPSHYAAFGGNASHIQPLIKQGLDLWCGTAIQQTLLKRSCETGHLEIMKELVKKFPDCIHRLDSNGETTAHYASESGNISVLQYLIKQEDDNNLKTPAYYAAQISNVSILQCLMYKGLNPWCRTVTQETLLHKSCLSGQLEMTQYLLEKYPDMVNEVDNGKRTPAHYASQRSTVSVLQCLTDKCRNPWCRTSTQETLLHMSCISGQLEMTRYLLEKYPDMINNVDNGERTPAHYAAQSSTVSVLQCLTAKGLNPWCKTATQETLLLMSCISGQLEMTQYLLEKYPDMVNEFDNGNRPQAHYAAQSSNVSVLQCLRDKGLNPWCRTSTQETLLHMSCISGQLEMTQYLLEKYPDVINEVDNAERTPAHCAAHSSNVSVLQCLIDKGLNPLCRTAAQETLLHMSCIYVQLEMTQYLLGKYPGMINEVDHNNETGAHYAAKRSNVSVLQCLIDKGLNPWCRTATEETLLHKSCISGQLKMTLYLLEKYPDMINEVDNGERTPAHCAAQSSNVSVLQCLINKGLNP
ncbi:hypothetical protein CHS0354_006558 [Potamilus streckersoni]|uniref:Novel STAND NTPase 3 domain-containing protein n=1 Tax=Potamilus streckersoni TaxID=2493646 RepID=A0AAE0TCR1_9BIVA|nr:hypothetical protein CHS0354_006558 [Potamilus streckersoni]